MGEFKQKLVIDSRLEAAAKARRWIVQQAEEAGFDAEAIFAIGLAIGEALANIVEHAYAGEAGHEIHIDLKIDATKLSLTLQDFGQKFNPLTYHPPHLGIPKEGGYGVYLIEQMMDEVIYDTSPEKGTRLELIKYKAEDRLD